MFPGWIAFVIFMSHAGNAAASALEVEVIADGSLDPAPRRLSVHAGCLGEPQGAPRRFTFTGNQFTTPPLPRECYRAALTIQGETRTDLAFPSVRAVRFDFRKVRLSGRITRAGEGVPASLEFVPTNPGAEGPASTPAFAQSDASGAYEARLWRGALYGVHIASLEGPTSKFRLLVADADEQSKDFALSSNTLVVSILDAKSGGPVPGARLVYIDSDGAQSPRADSTGTVTVDSVPAGPFHARAVAENYVNADGDWTIEDREGPQAFRVEMKPKSNEGDFQVFLPDGTPAAGAFGYYRFRPEAQSRILIRCDGDGICHPPEKPGGDEFVYLLHDGAGLTILPAAEIYASNSATLLPAGGPLVVNVKAGSKRSESCEFVVVTIGGLAIEQVSNWTCGAKPWPIEIHGLPAAEVEVTIVSRELDDHGRPGEPAVLGGPVPVTLPSEPIEIEIP